MEQTCKGVPGDAHGSCCHRYKYVETAGPWAGYMTAEQLLTRLRRQQAAQQEGGAAMAGAPEEH
jgi:hypothetical protein